jgi:tetraacyldisaccharide 4'-kinase
MRLLLPLSWLFRALVWSRFALYRMGVFRTERLPVPVIVVGNLTVGGAGKTPLTLALVRWLREAGYQPGVISRGYGGRAREPLPVEADSDPALVGDEPVLIARRAACPVWVARRRAEAGHRLLGRHPEVDVLLTDDGLQHYALARDLELVVVDAARGFGNGRLLPAGPLREPVARLARASALVLNGGSGRVSGPPAFVMNLRAGSFVSLRHPARRVTAEFFRGRRVHALAGIGHPERFFQTLAALGLDFSDRAFPDHHAFQPRDLPAGTLIMTEKDAVKCAAFAPEDAWFLAIDAEVEGGLKTLILNKLTELKKPHGSQTA